LITHSFIYEQHTLPPPPIMRQGMGSIPMMGLHSLGMGHGMGQSMGHGMGQGMGMGQGSEMMMSPHFPLSMQHHHHHQQQQQQHQHQQHMRVNNNGNGMPSVSVGAPTGPPDVADSKDAGNGGLPGLQFS
jgi:hypothetical protein